MHACVFNFPLTFYLRPLPLFSTTVQDCNTSKKSAPTHRCHHPFVNSSLLHILGHACQVVGMHYLLPRLLFLCLSQRKEVNPSRSTGNLCTNEPLMMRRLYSCFEMFHGLKGNVGRSASNRVFFKHIKAAAGARCWL